MYISMASSFIKKSHGDLLRRYRSPRSTPMELAARSSSSSSANFDLDQPDFYDFLRRMRQPSAADLVCGIKKFIASFSFDNSDAEDDSKKVQDFLTSMQTTIKEHPSWAHASEKEVDSAIEGLEKYIMTKLFSHTFASSPEDVKLDIEISEKIYLLQHFIKPDHLDVPKFLINESSLLLAAKELHKINGFKAPREKLLCVMNCCSVINNILLQISMSTNQELHGADVFLPTLIYVTIKANPPQLHSNLKYIQLFRMNSKLVSEVEYYFTNIILAKTFITSMNATSISMDESEFQKNMQLARLARQMSLTDPGSAIRFSEGNGTAINKFAEFDNVKGYGYYPFMEAEAEGLRLDDVKILLRHYKEVVLKYNLVTEALNRLSIDENQLLLVTHDSQLKEKIKQHIEEQKRIKNEKGVLQK